jgi:hypothetical protein
MIPDRVGQATLTQHARRRMQQRGIPPQVLDWLIDYGSIAYDHHGGRVRYLDHAGRRRLLGEVGSVALRRYHEKLDAYAVESADGAVLTVGHRYRRLPRGH